MKIPSPDERHEALLARRNKKMALSPHAYMRGNTTRYYEWLHSQRGHSLPHGPGIWICGDCHIGNLGPLADTDGKVDVQIRDFDQTVIGNPAHDLLRLALSLATAARDSNLPGIVTAHMLEHLMDGYEQALDAGEAGESRSKTRFGQDSYSRRAQAHMEKAGQGTHCQCEAENSAGKELLAPVKIREKLVSRNYLKSGKCWSWSPH